MLEGVFRVGRRSASEDQFRIHELLQSVIHALLRRLSYSADHLVRERSTERRSDLRYLASWSQSIESG